MTLLIDGHGFHYEMENLCRLFFPHDAIKVVHEPAEDEVVVTTSLRRGEDKTELFVEYRAYITNERSKAEVPNHHADYDNRCELVMAQLLFGILAKVCHFTPKWGVLTGVRPIKLMRRLMNEEGEAEARRTFTEDLLVSEEKTNLAIDTVRKEDSILQLSRQDSFSLYVSIPFCPSRCAYCSFVSMWVEKSGHLLPKYVELLAKEIEETGRVAKQLGLRLETIYFGGGTPTILSAEQLSFLIQAVNRSFDLSFVREFTVEAGRPDTITREKLQVMKDLGVTRISINPQTMQDDVLERIGRRHTVAQVRDAYAMAKEVGFTNINMDLIAGLPGDDARKFADTIRQVLELDPPSITVHTLALKRSSYLNQFGQDDYARADEVEAMLACVQQNLVPNGYTPYYLYRQSRTIGNLENIGWSKPGYEGYYNVYIMDETHTILAAGAAGVTKLKQPDGPYIERIFNFKFAYEYIDRFDEILARKKKVCPFYEKYGKCSQLPG
ncbi:coproporphyrinogen dehydrogenase HemZ [[Clostridium] leptum]|nr:coproporphyrinogen dehydrogenase HemZ [[Clostridium] leptum]